MSTTTIVRPTSGLAIVALLAGRFFDAAWLDPLSGILGGVLIPKSP